MAAAREAGGTFAAPMADADAPRPRTATLYVPGEDPGTHARRPLPPDRTGLAKALHDVHRAGVVHRDLEQADLMLAGDGPHVIDVGTGCAN
ncbi:hypothetical protein ACWD4N_14680 [Streptomyces sp. NPDC002586]|uniref:hypothetical protein n=1 Tax=Streptomyces sp. NPDC002589 TaxID=3154420 RepID=UPI00331FD173